MAEAPLEYIEITADNIYAGGNTPKGSIVKVSLIGEGTARLLIDAKKAKAVGKPKEASRG